MLMVFQPFAAAMTATQGTIRAAANFDALADAEKLRKAMKGFGMDFSFLPILF